MDIFLVLPFELKWNDYPLKIVYMTDDTTVVLLKIEVIFWKSITGKQNFIWFRLWLENPYTGDNWLIDPREIKI